MGPETEYALISLTQGQYATVDLLDCGIASRDKWRANWSPQTKSFYAITTRQITPGPKGRKIFKLHRVLMDISDSAVQVDHANRRTLDCRRSCNLRVATHAQNQMNRVKHRDNTSGFKGVNFSPRYNRWLARISTPNGRKYLGMFETAAKAGDAYCRAAQKFHKEFARV